MIISLRVFMKFLFLLYVCFCFLTCSVFKEHHVIIAANETIPTAINTTEQIGDEVTLHYRVRKNKTFFFSFNLVI